MTRWPIAVASAATAMLLLDATVVYVGLPAIGADLQASFEELQWTIDAYALTLAAALLPAGALADRLGRRRVLLGGLALFAAASAACALAGSGLALVLARGVQGVGAAAMYAASLALIAAAYEGRARAVALGIWGAVSGGALAAGPLVGGLLVDGPGWRWVFALNLPVAALCAAGALTRISESRDPVARRVDVRGALLLSAGLGLLVAGLLRGESAGWGSATILAMLGGGAALLVAFVTHELRTSEPMLDPRLFRRRAFAGTAALAFLQSVALYPAFLLIAVELQAIDGLSPLEAGVRVLPLTVALFVVAPFAGRLTARVPLGALLAVGLAIVGAGLIALRAAGPGDASTAQLLGFLLLGAGSGVLSPVLAAAMIASLPADRAGLASGIGNTFRQAGIAAGIALVGAVHLRAMGDDPEALAALRGGTGTPASHAAATAFDRGLDAALVAGALAALLGIAAAALVRAHPAD